MLYKIFYKDKEVAEFNSLHECIQYVLQQTKIDKELSPDDFKIYGRVN